MLVLTRGEYQAVVVSGPCRVVVTEAKDGKVKLGFEAEPSVKILREELLDAEARRPAKQAP